MDELIHPRATGYAPWPYGCGCQDRFGIPFWLVGAFTTHFRTHFSGDWDVHWGYDLDFEPWPINMEPDRGLLEDHVPFKGTPLSGSK